VAEASQRTNRKEHRGRSDTKDDGVMATLLQLINQDPVKSRRSMARELG
jgi:hypothetical protein